MAKLSELQMTVLECMALGWSLCSEQGFQRSAWLQEDGCGRGGETRSVNFSTLHSLSKRGLIRVKARDYPTTSWILAGPWLRRRA